jgi:hypothetical protein
MKHWPAILILVLFSACTTMKKVEQPTDAAIAEGVEEGDVILIHLKGGRRFTMEVESVEKDAISGVWPNNGKTYRVGFDRIASVEREEFSLLNTLAAIGGAYLLAGAVAIAAIFHGL